MFEKILLAVDGSEHSTRAAKEAGHLARAMKSDGLRIVVAFDRIPASLGEPYRQQLIDARLDEANEIVRKARDAIGEIPGEIQPEVIEGSAAEVIIDAAKACGSTVIVMGSRGMSRIADLVLGSTSQKVVSHAPCPVLIVR